MAINNKANPTKFHRSQIKFYVILVPFAAIMVLPILFIFFNAFKPIEELFQYPPSFIAKNPTLDNFKNLLTRMSTSSIPVTRYLFNSIIIAAVTLVVSITISLSAGYVLSKKKFKGKNVLFETNTIALMFIPVAVTIPRYLIIVKLGLANNFLSNILPILVMPIGLFLVKQFIDQVPNSLIEAAKIDGANDIKILFKIIIPMVKPAIATIAILSFTEAWGNVEASQLYIQDESLKNFAYYMVTFTSSTSSNAGQGIAAASVLILFVPNLLIFIIMQSKVMNTMAHSGIK